MEAWDGAGAGASAVPLRADSAGPLCLSWMCAEMCADVFGDGTNNPTFGVADASFLSRLPANTLTLGDLRWGTLGM
jgi:hypothetical protein